MILLLAHAAVTWFMTGLIWFVQIVHYPLFASVGENGFKSYALSHQQRTGWVVGPPMLIELVLAVWIAFSPPAGGPGWHGWLGLGLLVVIWISTAFLQVPAHKVLASGFDAATGNRLVRTNLIRTACWSGRGVLAMLMIAERAD